MNEGVDETLVRAALEELLGWDELSRSPQLAEFLRYVVEARLRGEEESVKAYAIAVDVFKRPPSFDPQADPIVRVQGGRLRTLIDRFYAEGSNTVPLRIRIPVGRYVPQFERLDGHGAGGVSRGREPPAPGADSAAGEGAESGSPGARGGGRRGLAAVGGSWRQFRRNLAIFLAGAAFVLVLVWLTGTTWMSLFGTDETGDAGMPKPPLVIVGQFANLTGIEALNEPVSGLGLQLRTDLTRFEDISVQLERQRDAAPPESAVNRARRFHLSGVVRRGAETVEFSMLLTDAANGDAVWTSTLKAPSFNGDYPLLIGRISRRVSAVLGSYQGPLHAAAQRWVSGHREAVDLPGTYRCRNLQALATARRDLEMAEGAIDCYSRVLARDPESATALAGHAGMRAFIAFRTAQPDAHPVTTLERPLEEALHARDLMPQSSFVRTQLARVFRVRGSVDAARNEYETAVDNNPADAGARAELALFLAYLGEWDAAVNEMETALAHSPSAPAWYHTVETARAIRARDYDAAVESALRQTRGDLRLGEVLALAAAGAAERTDVVERFMPNVLADPTFQAHGILVWLERYFSDQATLESIGFGLLASGVPANLIWDPTVESDDPSLPEAAESG